MKFNKLGTKCARVAVMAVALAALVMLAACGSLTTQAAQPTTDAYSVKQEVMEGVDGPFVQSPAQIASLSAYASYKSTEPAAEGLTGLDALAFDLYVQNFGVMGPEHAAALRISQGGFYVESPYVEQALMSLGDDEVLTKYTDGVFDEEYQDLLSTSSSDLDAAISELGYDGFPMGKVSQETSNTLAAQNAPLMGVFLETTEISDELLGRFPEYQPTYEGFSIVNPICMTMFPGTEQAVAVIGDGYAAPEEIEAGVLAEDLSASGIATNADFAQALWCCFKAKALDYEAINAAIDKYWTSMYA